MSRFVQFNSHASRMKRQPYKHAPIQMEEKWIMDEVEAEEKLFDGVDNMPPSRALSDHSIPNPPSIHSFVPWQEPLSQLQTKMETMKENVHRWQLRMTQLQTQYQCYTQEVDAKLELMNIKIRNLKKTHWVSSLVGVALGCVMIYYATICIFRFLPDPHNPMSYIS